MELYLLCKQKSLIMIYDRPEITHVSSENVVCPVSWFEGISIQAGKRYLPNSPNSLEHQNSSEHSSMGIPKWMNCVNNCAMRMKRWLVSSVKSIRLIIYNRLSVDESVKKIAWIWSTDESDRYATTQPILVDWLVHFNNCENSCK